MKLVNSPTTKLAILADNAIQLLSREIKAQADLEKFSIEIFEGEYGQIDQVINDPFSPLYKFCPTAITILHSVEVMREEFYRLPSADRHQFSIKKIAELHDLFSTINQKLPDTKIIISNLAELQDGVYGNGANKYANSFLHTIRKYNLGLMDLAQNNGNLHVLDIAILQSQIGRERFYDPRLYINASMSFSVDSHELIAKNIIDLVRVFQGGAKKCLILDLDNTLWGGIIGDDGIEKIEVGDLGQGKSFTLLQCWAKELKKRGVLLAICSKNTESVAKEPFINHPDMQLRLEDIAVFVANWEDKASNIRKIQESLNIGFDSMIFIDDNRFERELVKSLLPAVTVPEMPEDPAEYLNYLESLNLFEVGILSALDKDRTALIQTELERKKMEGQFTNPKDFVKNLEMKANILKFNKFNTPRIAQLSERSNQFNLRTVRYSEQDIQRISQDSSYISFTVSIGDRLGDHGLIAVVVLRQEVDALFIENWFMSCRVLKRGVEQLTLEKMVALARDKGFKKIIGEYLPTKKNALVANHYQDLNFQDLGGGFWSLDVANHQSCEHFIGVTSDE
jgi:FkbH-like protein